jgi:hypothetical protein
MRVETIAIPSNTHSIAPATSAGEELIATFLVPGSGDVLTFKDAKPVSVSAIEHGRLKISGDLSNPSSAALYLCRTGMMVKQPQLEPRVLCSTIT